MDERYAKRFWPSKGNRRWTLKEANALGYFDIRKMSTPEKAELAQFYRNQFGLRIEQFAKAGTVGYAVHKLTADMAEMSEKLGIDMNPLDPIVVPAGRGQRRLSNAYVLMDNPQNKLGAYISLMQKFFTSKSGTVKGWREIGEEQDKRLFGEDVKIIRGKRHKGYQEIRYEYTPKRRMTDRERTLFWRIYHDISKTRYVPLSAIYAQSGQDNFATLWQSPDMWKGIDRDSDNDDALDYDKLYARMQALLDREPDNFVEHAPGMGNHSARAEGGDNINGNYGIDDDYFNR